MMLAQQIEDIDFAPLMKAEGINLQRRGNKYFARCPFHNEKTASFCIFPDGHAKCFGWVTTRYSKCSLGIKHRHNNTYDIAIHIQ